MIEASASIEVRRSGAAIDRPARQSRRTRRGFAASDAPASPTNRHP
jgi:hypothetical protein